MKKAKRAKLKRVWLTRNPEGSYCPDCIYMYIGKKPVRETYNPMYPPEEQDWYCEDVIHEMCASEFERVTGMVVDYNECVKVEITVKEMK